MKFRALLVVSVALALLPFAALADGEAVEVTGEVLDMACYVSHEAHGADHAECAERCVKGCQPMGLLTDDGNVYVLFANHKDMAPYEAAKDHAGATVTVTGTMSERAGVKGITVDGVDAG